MNGTLYRIINMKNGKSYIGKTYRSIYDRLEEHLYEAKILRNRTPLYLAINEYGEDSFTMEIIGTFPSNELEKKEIEYIKLYGSFIAGYNSTLGGDGGPKLELDEDLIVQDYLESNNMVSVSLKHNCSATTVRNLLLTKNVEIKRPTSAGPPKKAIFSPSLNMNFSCAKETAEYLRETGIVTDISIASMAKGIRSAATKNRSGYKGHSFYYINNNEIKIVFSSSLNKYFSSVTECAEYLLENNLIVKSSKINTIESSIRQVCTGYRKTFNGHTFTYIYENNS
jgi:hypothetical protein